MPYLTVEDGTEIHYRDWGTGKPIVLIHGWPLNGEMWEKQATFLAEQGFRVITYDRRGFGMSSHPWGGYDYDTFAADLNALMEKLNLFDVTFVGFSMGGGEVARYLSTFGARRVSKAVLVSAVTPFLLKTADNPEGIDQGKFDDIAFALRADRPAFLKDFALKFFGRTAMFEAVSDGVLEWNQSMALTASLRSTLAAARAWSTTDFRTDLKRITIPVLLIHGTADVTVPIEISARKAVQMIPIARLHEYEGEPHGLFITVADRLNKELVTFIEELRAPLRDSAVA